MHETEENSNEEVTATLQKQVEEFRHNESLLQVQLEKPKS